ncbi:MAG: NUDIX domain-containing protein [Cyclobacteriaceae bacterium]|nr:NUDIX domain-containing protein [Cyclobacteriaceae bacterium]
MDRSVQQIYGNRVRVRVCGICVEDGKILLINHHGLSKGDFWAPPGGGMEVGSSAQENLVREFREETGLEISVGQHLFTTEFIHPPLHAIELFFAVTRTGGSLKAGQDPEMGAHDQLIRDARFLTFQEVDALRDEEKHGSFRLCGESGGIRALNGYFTISPVSSKTA